MGDVFPFPGLFLKPVLFKLICKFIKCRFCLKSRLVFLNGTTTLLLYLHILVFIMKILLSNLFFFVVINLVFEKKKKKKKKKYSALRIARKRDMGKSRQCFSY